MNLASALVTSMIYPGDGYPDSLASAKVLVFPLLDFVELECFVVLPQAQHAVARIARTAVFLECSERLPDRIARRCTFEAGIDRDAQAQLAEPGSIQLVELAAGSHVNQAWRG